MTLDPGRAPTGALATAGDIRHYLGDLDETLVTQILALGPTVDQVAAAALWLEGEGDRLSRSGRPLEAQVAAIFDILAINEEEDDR